ncbi:MAG: acyl-CoA dehydrogenase family protein [Candidatus Limnocylindria bacterium]
MTVDTRTRPVPTDQIAATAAEVDREARFPTESIAALRAAGLLGIGLDETYGGPGGGPSEVVAVVESVAGACASTGMIFTMHVVATQTLVAGTDEPADGVKADVLRAIAAGDHLATLAYSERGSRSHFWAQVSRAIPDGDGVIVSADKSWVTSAGHADSYVTASGAPGSDDPTTTELYLIDARAPGLEVLGGFDGLGMRGNASSPVAFRGVSIAPERRIGGAATGFGLMMSATLPWFVLCSAATSVGIAGAAITAASAHVTGARFEHLGSSLADIPGVRARLAEAKIRHMQARALLYEVAAEVASGGPGAQLGVLALKAAAAEMAIDVTDQAMRACGGAAFSRHLGLERQFRDARAASVMAPTTDVLHDLLGKALTGQDLF